MFTNWKDCPCYLCLADDVRSSLSLTHDWYKYCVSVLNSSWFYSNHGEFETSCVVYWAYFVTHWTHFVQYWAYIAVWLFFYYFRLDHMKDMNLNSFLKQWLKYSLKSHLSCLSLWSTNRYVWIIPLLENG